MKYILETGALTAEEFIQLSKDVGWGPDRQYEMKKVEKALQDSSFTVRVRTSEGKTVACGRAFSDDLLMTFIPDIFVHPDHQRHGLGSLIMEAFKEKYGHTTFFFGAQPGKESFYENLGFRKGMQSYTGSFRKNPYFD
jgi:GNAT superfamily N-acetyltransferase